ncbi:MAG TPA: hypothetical protein VJQ55_13450 [Candidatus Binatia bacterium]|nr:hypothetical protein [Candidatus Binatia bacterium]
MYATALKRSWECLRKNWIVSFAPLAYGIILAIIVSIVAPLGLIGGLLFSLASQTCISSGLFLVKNMIDSNKADFNDFLNGFTVYLWELLGIAFILWIPLRVLAMALETAPNGALIYFLIKLALYILLNPVPEFIYQTRTSGLELISASYNFIVENWIEWLIPNLLLFAAGYVLLELIEPLLFGLPGFVALFLYAFIAGLGLTYFMTFRGFLFAQLHGTTRRSRLYRYRAQS